MANGLPPPARIPSSEAIRKAALARSAKRGARVAAWRLGFRWLLWGSGQALIGLGALTAAAAVFMGLRWGWTAVQASGPAPRPEPQAAAPPLKASAPTPASHAALPEAEPASLPATATSPRRGYPLRLDDSEPAAAPKRAAAGAQSPATRNTETQRP
ncbi:hypothetical protein BurJ1DRAFT_1245 [Burkholderiales bacterium JOSHI_001]|nr:hypothetical protein BurJ1DRAFT_1245 [Burkholderiales bacterium JOSHI_001]